VCINLEVAAETEPSIIRLEVSKNRLVDDKVMWYFKKEEGAFIFSGPPLGIPGEPTDTSIYKTQHKLLEIMQTEVEYPIGDLADRLQKAGLNGTNYNIVDKALRRLTQQGRLRRPRHGFYAKVGINLPYAPVKGS
jgi:hypothetical protein